MIITHKLKMNLLEPGNLPRIHAVQDDRYTRNLQLELYQGSPANTLQNELYGRTYVAGVKLRF